MFSVSSFAAPISPIRLKSVFVRSYSSTTYDITVKGKTHSITKVGKNECPKVPGYCSILVSQKDLNKIIK